jgi:hypothetical protein
VRWPLNGATEVATDTPIVISRYYIGGDLDEITFELTDEEGDAIALEETHRIEPPWEGCGESQYLFLRPTVPLTAGATYTLTIAAAADPQGAWGSTFTVGEQPFEPEPPIDLQPIYLSVDAVMACEDEGCRHGEILVDLGDVPTRPRWLVVKSGAAENNVNQWEFWPSELFDGMGVPEGASRVQLSVVLPADDPCIDIELFGVEGRSLFHERRCTADRCALSDVLGIDDCGGPTRSTLDVSAVPEGSCDGTDAGVTIADAGVAVDAGGPEARQPVEAERRMKISDGGCSVNATRGGGRSCTWPLMLAVLGYALRGARRRAH